MKIRIRRIFIPLLFCLAVACLIEIPLGQTDLFGGDVILWDTLFRAIAAMPGLLYFYREDAVFRSKERWDLKTAVLLVLAGAAGSVIFRILFVFAGIPGYDAAEKTLITGNILLQAAVLLAASPLLEEFFFRGVLYGRLKELFPVSAAMVLSSACFGLYHGNIAQGVYGFFMGLLLSWSMEHCQTVKAPIAVHMAANGAALIAALL